jgi:uncharacterized protein with PQ loop repeat
MNKEKMTRIIGLLGAFTGIVFTGPGTFAQIWKNFQTHSVSGLSLPYYGTLIVNFLLWFIYGWLKKDIFITVPNTIGFLGTLFLLIQFYLYG